MKQIFIVLIAMAILGINKVAAQSDSSDLAMNTFMAKAPDANTSVANVSMWPNPATSNVNIYINSIRSGDRGQCVLYNAQGKPCLMANLQNGNNKIYFNALPEGIYFMNVKLKNNIVFSKKLIVNNSYSLR